MIRPMVLSLSIAFCGSAFATQAENIQALIKQLSSWNTDKAKKASDELAAMGRIVVPDVAGALSSSNRRRGRFAARTLREIGQDAADAIPALSESLKDSDALTREYSVEALAKMLRQADRLIPLLQEMTEDEDENVRAQAKSAVLRLNEALKARDRAESAQQPATGTSTAITTGQTIKPSVTDQHAPSQPGSAEGSYGPTSAEKKDQYCKPGPKAFVRFALFMFVPIGFFALLYFYRDYPSCRRSD